MSSVFHRARRGERKSKISQINNIQEDGLGLRERPGGFALVPHGFAACP